jgi:methyltransferase family protein
MFSFTRLPMAKHPLYTSTILPTLQKPGTTLLDLGCGFASDFRSLGSAGIPSSSLTALDNHDGFWNLGKEMFSDHDTMKARFEVADMTNLSSIPVDMLGAFDVIWAGASFHLFDWDGQVKAGVVACKLLRDRKGSAIFGYQVGRTEGKAVRASVVGKMLFNHDAKTLEKIWEEVGEQAGMKFEVQSWMDDRGVNDLKWLDPEVRRQRFAVVRVDGPDGDD